MAFSLPFFDFDTLLFRIVALVIALVLHDAVQAWLAYVFGDPTAKERGRLTLNPRPHLDAVGLAMVLFGPYGWSRPVPTDPGKFRRNPRFSQFLVYALGPVLHALLGLLFWWLYFALLRSTDSASAGISLLTGVLHYCYIVNIMLAVLQLLPFYPMDGWKAITSLTPLSWRDELHRAGRWGMAVVIFFMITPFGQRTLETLFWWLSGSVMNAYDG